MTAARAASLALFRELFPGELLAPGQLATVSTVTLLVTALDPAQADALYQDLGDARAFSVVHEHFQRLGDPIRQGGGAVVKTMGEGLLASFSDVTAAVKTALELARPFATTESEATTGPLRLRVGVHRGPTLAATVNDQLDYFGTTARQATAILQYARGAELVLTRTVAADPEVAALLSDAPNRKRGRRDQPGRPSSRHPGAAGPESRPDIGQSSEGRRGSSFSIAGSRLRRYDECQRSIGPYPVS